MRRGPACHSSQAGGGGSGWLSCSSCGGRCTGCGCSRGEGKTAATSPTAKLNDSSNGTLRRHKRQGNPLAKVISSSRATKASRHHAEARMGVSKNAKLQAYLSLGSRRRSQPRRPATYWPRGSCRSQSISGWQHGPDPVRHPVVACRARTGAQASPQNQGPGGSVAPRNGGRCRRTVWAR